MLAKVLKSQPLDAFAPFIIPHIGNSNQAVAGIATFAFPQLIDLTTNVVTAETKSEMDLPQTTDILENAAREAAALLANAEAQSAAIEQAALEKGLQQADRKVAAEAAAKSEELRLKLSETIFEIANLRSEIAAQAENDVVRLALEIARKIVGREVTIDREIAVTLARIALARLNSRAVAAVHLHPEDYVYVNAHREKLAFHGALELVEDRSIGLGGCLVRTETGDLDARIEAQFAEISNGLLD